MKESNRWDCVFVCVYALSIFKKYDFTTQLNDILTQRYYIAQKAMMCDESIICSKEYIDVNVKQGVKSSRLDKNEIVEMRIDDSMPVCLCCWSYESAKGPLHQVHIFLRVGVWIE